MVIVGVDYFFEGVGCFAHCRYYYYNTVLVVKVCHNIGYIAHGWGIFYRCSAKLKYV